MMLRMPNNSIWLKHQNLKVTEKKLGKKTRPGWNTVLQLRGALLIADLDIEDSSDKSRPERFDIRVGGARRLKCTGKRQAEEKNWHNFVVADDFDGDLLAGPVGVAAAHHVGEDALARVAVDRVAAVERLADADAVVALGVVPVVGQVRILGDAPHLLDSRGWTLLVRERMKTNKQTEKQTKDVGQDDGH